MSAQRFLRMTAPIAITSAGLALLIVSEYKAGLTFTIIGLAGIILFKKELKEVVDLADTDKRISLPEDTEVELSCL